MKILPSEFIFAESWIFYLTYKRNHIQANDWIHRLSPLLKTALKQDGSLPPRDPAHLQKTASENPENHFAIDGTERGIQRPKDGQKQKNYYSGKKKKHTVKNNLIVGLKDRLVKYLSQTYEGKIHDKKICDVENPTFPDSSLLWKDTGFQGYEPPGVTTLQPKKKPKGKELSDKEKEPDYNELRGGGFLD